MTNPGDLSAKVKIMFVLTVLMLIPLTACSTTTPSQITNLKSTGTATNYAPASTPLSEAVLSVSIDRADLKPGDAFSVTISIHTRSAYRGAQWALDFNPAEMQCNSFKEGNFFKDWTAANDGTTVVFPQPVIDNQSGQISDMGIAVMADRDGGATGDGVLCTYQFTARSDRVSVPTILDASVADVKGNMLRATVSTPQ